MVRYLKIPDHFGEAGHDNAVEVLEHSLDLIDRIRAEAEPAFLSQAGHLRGAFQVDKALTIGGALLLEEGLGAETLPYASGENPTGKGLAMEVRMCLEGPRKFPEMNGSLEPSARATASHFWSAT